MRLLLCINTKSEAFWDRVGVVIEGALGIIYEKKNSSEKKTRFSCGKPEESLTNLLLLLVYYDP